MRRFRFVLTILSLFSAPLLFAQQKPVPDGPVVGTSIGGLFAASPQATKVWDIYRDGANCYGQDLGTVLHRQGWDRWLIFYGAVSDQFGGFTSCPDTRVYPACGTNLGDYSENIWLTWSMTDGKEFGQEAGVKPPVLLLTSLDFARWYNSHLPPDTPIRYVGNGTRWLIGDPAVGVGESGIWYMFFDTQGAGCGNVPGVYEPQNGIYVATSDSWHSDWEIRGKPTLPGAQEFVFPSIFREPDTGEIFLYYGDRNVTIRGAKVVDDGTGLTLEPLNGGNPVISDGCCLADRISVFKYNGKYYAITDRFGEGKPESMNTLYLLGPSDNPYGFDWSKKKSILERQDGTFYDQNLWAPNVVSPLDGDPANVRVYFWGAGTPGCWFGGHESAGLLEFPVSQLP